MASLEKRRLKHGVAYVVVFYRGSKKCKIYLGRKYKLQDAKAVMVAVESFVDSEEKGETLPRATKAFFETAPTDLLKRLSSLGNFNISASHTLKTVWESYLGAKSAIWKHGSLVLNGTVYKRLEMFFGANKKLGEITFADAESFKTHLLQKTSAVTTSLTISKVKTFIRWANKNGYVSSNVFEDIKAGSEVNKSRTRYITREESNKILSIMPNKYWRLLFACWRYAGMRREEPYFLHSDSFDLENKVVTIYSPKTEHSGKAFRRTPILPELYEILQEGIEYPFFGSVSKQNAYTGFKRILQRNGIEQWERLIQNLRASFENDLVESGFPQFVVAEWVGHTVNTQEKHYLQVTQKYFEIATKNVG